ncbi:MAG TPA: hypothetical protein VFB99_19235 [Vicinamibacterales bacterium]|nr:hypothetical protein [Vicinamibacterales bacterium]
MQSAGRAFLSSRRLAGSLRTSARQREAPYVLQRLRAPRYRFETFAGVLLFFAVGVAGVIGLPSFLDAAVVIGTGVSIALVPLWGDQRGAVVTHTDITRRKQENAETLPLHGSGDDQSRFCEAICSDVA